MGEIIGRPARQNPSFTETAPLLSTTDLRSREAGVMA